MCTYAFLQKSVLLSMQNLVQILQKNSMEVSNNAMATSCYNFT